MSVLLKRPHSRRAMLRGILGGGAVSVALPFLDCFLNDHGTAQAAGTPLPVRFGTWFWGLGHTPGVAVVERTATGPGMDFLQECAALTPLKAHLNYFGGFKAPLDGRSNYTHFSGWVASRTGTAPLTGDEVPAPTLDLLVADVIGTRTRFKTIDLSATGNPRDCYSARNTHSRSAAEVSPIGFYARLFGPEFVDPNKADFKPNLGVMMRKSVLSGITDDRKKLMNSVGATDRAQLEEYFTSIRELETQLQMQLQKPAANDACRVIPRPEDTALSTADVDINLCLSNHKVLSQILAMAVACDQTAVFNMVFNDSTSRLRKAGESLNHHGLSHEEPMDPKLGYQPQASWFTAKCMDALANYIQAFANIREGSGTLLDNTLIFAASETSVARVHSVDNIPIFTAGKAGGRVKTGISVVGNGAPITRVGLTAMQVMGAQIEQWGTRSLQTSKPITEILAS